MPQQDIDVIPYTGSLASAQLLSAQQTLILSHFGAQERGTLSDDDGNLSGFDDGLSTFNGQPITYIGSGTATPGVDVLGVTVPLGASKPLMAFEAGGQIYFHFPEGQPNLVSAVALVIDLSPAGYNVFTPVCFAAGTMILLEGGERPVEEVRAGDTAIDWFGGRQPVRWSGQRRLRLPESGHYAKWRPVRIRAGALGPGQPSRDTWLSQQHRVYLEAAGIGLLSGEPAGLAAAKQLVNGHSIAIDPGPDEITYCHILCSGHTVLVANGMPAESLLASMDAGNPEHQELFAEIRALLPEAPVEPRMAAPVLTAAAARVHAASLAAGF